MKKTIALVLFLIASVASADELTDRINKIASTTDATFGVSAMDLDTGRRFSLHGDERFPMASVYKFPIALAVLKKVSKGEILLDRKVTIEPKDFAPGHSPLAQSANGKPVTLEVGRLLVLSLGESDNSAADALMRLVGGPQGVMTYLRFIGISGIDVSRSEKQIGADLKKSGVDSFEKDPRDTATPDAMAMLARLFVERAEGLTAFSRNFAIEIMRRTTSGARRIRAGVPAGADVLDKTGTNVGILNDAGIVKTPDGAHRIVMVIFSKGARKSSEEAREQAVASIAREIYDEFTKRRD
jgi:beta-lactamase class A